MPKRKNGGDGNLFSKIGKAARSAGAAAGSAGAAGLKTAATEKAIDEAYAVGLMGTSRPLQSRQTFLQEAPYSPSDISFKDKDIEKLKELGRRAVQSLDQEGLIK